MVTSPDREVLSPPCEAYIEGDSLIYSSRHKLRIAKPLVFESFINLDPGDSKAILRFARSWGAMWVCKEHTLPYSHSRHITGGPLASRCCFPAQVARDSDRFDAHGFKFDPFFSEPLAFWRELISRARMLRRIGCDIESGGNGDPEDWRAVEASRLCCIDPGTSDRRVISWRNHSHATNRFSMRVQEWLEVADIRPSFSWSNRRQCWILEPASPGGATLFGWLGIRLAVEIAGGRQATCSYCGITYFPGRLPGSRKSCCGSVDCKRRQDTANKQERRKNEQKTRTK
jgi:hypothetical protein